MWEFREKTAKWVVTKTSQPIETMLPLPPTSLTVSLSGLGYCVFSSSLAGTFA